MASFFQRGGGFGCLVRRARGALEGWSNVVFEIIQGRLPLERFEGFLDEVFCLGGMESAIHSVRAEEGMEFQSEYLSFPRQLRAPGSIEFIVSEQETNTLRSLD